MSSRMTDHEVQDFREHLQRFYKTDFGVSDERIREVAGPIKERVQASGRRRSWKYLAGEALKEAADG